MLDEKVEVVVVTGTSKGIGLSIAKWLIKLGVRVVGLSRSDTPIDSNAFIQIKIDVIDIDPLTLTDIVASRLGINRSQVRVRAVIHNAAISKIARIIDSTPAKWLETFNLNLFAAISLLKAFKPQLQQNAAFIIVSSIASSNAKAGWGAYCTSKAAVNMFVRCIALEELDLIALSVDPGMMLLEPFSMKGVVDTDMQTSIRELGAAGGMIDRDHAKIVKLFEDGKVLDADVPGKAIAHLALNATKEMSGELIVHTDPRILRMMA